MSFPKYLNKKRFLVIIFLVLLVFTRFWNLDNTTRFTRDESQNLVDMHRIWVDKDLTLIGPIDDTKTIIYPSLTFYMLLPFAVIGGFAPVSPAYGTAFFGILTVLFVIYLSKKVNSKLAWLTGLLSLVWIPFVESARWAWNPHLVPFVQSLAIIFFFKKKDRYKFISGILFGLSFHLHYLAFVGFAAFLLTWGLYSFYKKKWKQPLLNGFGFALTILPFIYFDIKNPPGLFFGRFMQDNMVRTGFSYELQNFWQVLAGNTYQILIFLSQSRFLAIPLGVGFLYLLFKDIKYKSKNLFFFVPLIAQTAVISFLPTFATRYFLLAIIFFLIWLISERKGLELKIVKVLIVIMFLGSLSKLAGELTVPKGIPTTYTVDQVTDKIKQTISDKDLHNVNIAILASPDRDPLGDVYRHTLLVKETRIMSEYEYHLTQNLFVISTSGIDEVREDPANVLNGFREDTDVESESLDNGWHVYLLERI